MFQTKLDDFFDFFDLLRETADHVVGAVWHFFYHHERDKGIDRGGKGLFELVGIGEECDAFADCELSDVDTFRDVDDWVQVSVGSTWMSRLPGHTIFAFWMHFDQNFLRAHHLHHFSHVGARLL